MKKGCLIIVGIFLALVVIGIVFKPSEATRQKLAQEAAARKAKRAEVSKPQGMEKDQGNAPQAAQDPQQPAKPSSQWTYSTDEDSMGRKRSFAIVTSTNMLDFKFPYRGSQHGTLMFRRSAESGLNVLLSIERGQFICGFNDCAVNVRFDSGQIMRISASAPADHSSTLLFLENEARLLSLTRKSKIARFEATFYQEGAQTLEFNVEGLEWK